MQTIYTMHETNACKLALVMDDMDMLGSPVIRVVDCGDFLVAIEGVHRIAAAAAKGIAPKLVVLEQDDMVSGASLDWQDYIDANKEYEAGELAGEAYSTSSVAYSLDDEGYLTAG